MSRDVESVYEKMLDEFKYHIPKKYLKIITFGDQKNKERREKIDKILKNGNTTRIY